MLGLLLLVPDIVVHQENTFLQIVVLTLEGFVLLAFIVDGHDQFLLHFRRTWQIANTTIIVLVILVFVKLVIIIKYVA